MLNAEREQLAKAAAEHSYMSVAINEDGKPVRAVFVPWELTVSAYNMRTPKVTLAVQDLQDPAVLDDLMKCGLTGCYIMAPLADYSFLSAFAGLNDLFIQHGERVRDLSFVRNMPHLFLFYLEDAVLPDLRPLIENCNEGKSLPGKRFGFYRCRVADTSALSEVRFYLSELLVWPADGDSQERWKLERQPGIFRYYSK